MNKPNLERYGDALDRARELVERAFFPYEGTDHNPLKSLVYVTEFLHDALWPDATAHATRLVWCSMMMHVYDGFSAHDPSLPGGRA